jgi:hypothetical protein
VPDEELPEAALALYRLPLDEFIAERERLAKELRAGDKAAAAVVHALRRPANAAWALNQVAAQTPEVVARAMDAGGELRDASAAGDRTAIVEATHAERTARDAAADAAIAMLHQADLPAGEAVRQQVLDTLHAAIVDDDVAAQLHGGTLDKAYASSGFGLGDAVPSRTTAPKAPASNASTPAETKAEAKARAEAERVTAEAERAARAERARRAADAERAAKRAARLERDADAAEAKAIDARRAADEARAEADDLVQQLAGDVSS